MWLECIRYRFRLDPDQDCLELAQTAALQSLRHSPRCRSWRVLPSPTDPSLSILEIEWDAGPSLAPFRGSEEFSALHAALTQQVRALDEADYRADTRLLRRSLGGPDAVFRLAEDIVARVMREPELAGRFHSRDGSRRARLGLWVLEVLGGPTLFSSHFPSATRGDGPLAGEPLDLDERELFIEVARECVPSAAGEPGSGVLGALREHLPLYPPPQSPAPESGFGGDELVLAEGLVLEAAFEPRAYLAAPAPATGDEPRSGQYAPSGVEPRRGGAEPASSRVAKERSAEPGAADGAGNAEDAGDRAAGDPEGGERSAVTRRRLGGRYRLFDSGVFPQARRQTAKR